MNSNTSKSVSVTAVTKRVRNNRKNGKRYEGELVKTLKEMGISSRLGRSNEEGDVILPEHNLVIEVKSTNLRDRYPISKSPDQFFRLKRREILNFCELLFFIFIYMKFLEAGNFNVCEQFTCLELHIYEIPEQGITELCIILTPREVVPYSLHLSP